MDRTQTLQAAMEMTGDYAVPAPRERVWDALRDPVVLADCIPGCRELRQLAPSEYEGRFLGRVGPVEAALSGRATVYGQDFPDGWMMAAHAHNLGVGWIGGEATLTLTPAGDGTRIGYRARVDAGGRFASVGPQVFQVTARGIADAFFARLVRHLAPVPAVSGLAPGRRTTVLAVGVTLWVMILLQLFLSRG
ncbi:MAG: carbon monoxide dehydrogenase subunit G [Magnetospirillum sp.]|nr:carbon monoxide dehydrogenase subunit G [Magnetospirillum sp.]